MKKFKTLIARLAFVVVATLVVLGCSAPSGPSKADVSEAFVAMFLAEGAAPTVNTVVTGGSGTYTASTLPQAGGGTIQVSYTSIGNPNTGPASITGTLTFANWYDQSTGYTINGTLSVTETTSAALGSVPLIITMTITGNLTLSGGAISKLGCNISESITNTGSNFSVTMSGTITANGYQYNINSL